MAANRNNRFSYNLSLVGLLLFIVVNVWLSLVIKKLKKEAVENNMLIKQEQTEALRVYQHISTLKTIFCMNMGLSGGKLNKPAGHDLQSLQTDDGVMLLLYLKAYACSECNMHIINWIVKRNASLDDFRIISHSSNSFYLDEMHNEGVITDPSIILWYDEELYDKHLSESTADLLFVDRHYVIQALFPLDYIKDPCLFDEHIECLNTAFNRLSRH